MSAITPVILCGGSGTRLWPRSRKTRPKPFLPLIGERPLFVATLDRCGDSGRFGPPLVVTGRDHLALVEEQLAGRAGARVIVEPVARNTAAAIALAAHRVDSDAVILVCPSDHHIGDCEAFAETASRAAALAAQGWLVSFGIAATTPETGFGYIRQGEPIAVPNGEGEAYRVESFVEKPDRERAERFLAEGGYSWNGGIFAFRAGSFLEELARYRPALADAVAASVAAGRQDGHRFHPEAELFAAVQSESVDYAVMENTASAAVVPAAMDWSDIGNWQALREALPRDGDGNARRGRAELIDCRDVLVDSDGPRVSVIGLEDLIVVVDGGEVLVTSGAGAQKVGKLDGAKQQ